MIPVYVFYSMFGFQRTGDQMWALGDQLGRGFLLGATAGRTTLTGEGLQHNDGHSPLLASVSPACVSYDAAWGYELAYIVRDGLRRMYGSVREHPHGEDIFYYLTVYNEPYVAARRARRLPGRYRGPGAGHPARALPVRRRARPRAARPDGTAATAAAGADPGLRGGACRWALDAQRLLAEDWGVAADVWSATSWTELRRDALACEEWNLLHPDAEPRVPYVDPGAGRASPARWWRSATGCGRCRTRSRAGCRRRSPRWAPTGTGFSDTRAAARRFFHVDAESITLAVLSQLARRGEVKPEALSQAVEKYRLDFPVSAALAPPS